MSRKPSTLSHAVKAAPVRVRRGGSFAAGFEAVAHNCLAQIRANEAGVLAGHGESLHQMRVGIRRLRALLSAVQPFYRMPLDEELRWLGTTLGGVRNWDVLTDTTLPALAAPPQVIDAARQVAVQQRANASAVLGSQRCRDLLASLELWCHERLWQDLAPEWRQPLRRVARRLLRKAGERIRRRVARLAPEQPDTLHRLRIAAKKERYLREFFQPDKSGKRLDQLVAAQERLGTLNDNHIACALLRELRERLPAEASQLAFLEGVLTGRQEHAAKAARRFARRAL